MKRKGSLVSTDWKKANAVKLKFQLLKTYKELYQSMDLYEENKLQINAFVLAIAKDGGVAAPMSRRRQKLDSRDYIEDELPAGYERMHNPLEPVYDENSRILILGSFPSARSRENGFHYGDPKNRFWKLLARRLESRFRRIPLRERPCCCAAVSPCGMWWRFATSRAPANRASATWCLRTSTAFCAPPRFRP